VGVTTPLLIVAGCAAPAPSCDAAWEATAESLSEMLAEAGTTATFPPREAYVERCAALPLTPAQLRCLEPERVLGDPAGCEAELAPVRAEVEALAAWFAEGTVLEDPTPTAPSPSSPDRSPP
jgi:hypothetical protein